MPLWLNKYEGSGGVRRLISFLCPTVVRTEGSASSAPPPVLAPVVKRRPLIAAFNEKGNVIVVEQKPMREASRWRVDLGVFLWDSQRSTSLPRLLVKLVGRCELFVH
jgi:hypothetical protein